MIAMIPARIGSQRLKQKNLMELAGLPLITHAVRKCKAANVFDEIWVNADHAVFQEIAEQEDVRFHQRPAPLATDQATSEGFVAEFLENRRCDCVFQVHSIAPLLSVGDIQRFVNFMTTSDCDVLLSVVEENLECVIDGKPINFSFDIKSNSQDLTPIQRIVWSITGWRRDCYLDAFRRGKCATYAGKIAYFPVDRLAGHVIKNAADFAIAEALFPVTGP